MGSWTNVPLSLTLEFEKIEHKRLPLLLGRNAATDKAIEQALKSGSHLWVSGSLPSKQTPAGPKTSLLLDRHAGEAEIVWIDVDAESTGYSDPGRTYGPPENCYPPEWEDERTVTEATFHADEPEIEVGLEEDDLRVLEQECDDEISSVQLVGYDDY